MNWKNNKCFILVLFWGHTEQKWVEWPSTSTHSKVQSFKTWINSVNTIPPSLPPWGSGKLQVWLDQSLIQKLTFQKHYRSQPLWVRFWDPKNVPSSCTYLGPAQVMEVIIIDVYSHAHPWVITSNNATYNCKNGLKWLHEQIVNLQLEVPYFDMIVHKCACEKS